MKINHTILAILAALVTIGATQSTAADSLTWYGENAGKSGTDKWVDKDGAKNWESGKKAAEWSNGSDAVLDKNGSSIVRVTRTAVVANDITVSTSGYWLGVKTTSEHPEATLSAASLTLEGADDSTLTLTHVGIDSKDVKAKVEMQSSKVTITGNMTVSNSYNLYLDSMVTFDIAGALDIAEGKALTLNKAEKRIDAASGYDTVEKGEFTAASLSCKGSLSVGENVTLNLGAQGSSVNLGSAITNNGTIVLNGNLEADASMVVAGEEYDVDLDGNKVEATKNHFSGARTADTITLATDGGTIIANDYDLTVGSATFVMGSNGVAVNNDSAAKTDYTTYYMVEEGKVVALSDIVTASEAALETVELGAGTLKADVSLATVNATGGTIAYVNGGDIDTVNVNGDITITGTQDVDSVTYNLAAQKIATFTEGLATAGLSVVGENGVKVENTSANTAIQYSWEETDAKLSASSVTLTAAAEAAVTVGNQVAAYTVGNSSSYALTLLNGVEGLGNISATSSDIILYNMGAAGCELQEVTIGNGVQVALYQGGTEAAEVSVSIGDTLTAGGGTLLANLILDGATLDVNGGGDNALTLGSQFGIAEGTQVTLDDATITALEGLQIGGTLDLVKALSPQDQLSYLSDYDGMWFDALFERTDNVHGDYKVYATGESFGLTKVSNVPEPTTGTLSLLGLAALAARRRRK